MTQQKQSKKGLYMVVTIPDEQNALFQKICAFWTRPRIFKQIPLIAASVNDQQQGIFILQKLQVHLTTDWNLFHRKDQIAFFFKSSRQMKVLAEGYIEESIENKICLAKRSVGGVLVLERRSRSRILHQAAPNRSYHEFCQDLHVLQFLKSNINFCISQN